MSKHLPDLYYLEAVHKQNDGGWLRGKVFKTPLSAVQYVKERGYDRNDFMIKTVEILYYPSNCTTDFRTAGPPHDK